MSQRDDDGAMFFLRALDEADARPAPLTKRANAAIPAKPAPVGLQPHDMTPMAKKDPKATTATGPTSLSPAQKPAVAGIADKAKTAGDMIRIARAATIPSKTYADISKLASVLLERSLRPAQVKKAFVSQTTGHLQDALNPGSEGAARAILESLGPRVMEALLGGARSMVGSAPAAALGAAAAGPGRRMAGAVAGGLGSSLGGRVGDSRLFGMPGSLVSSAMGMAGRGLGALAGGRMMRAPAAPPAPPPAPPPGALERLLASMRANPGTAAAGAGAAGLGAYGLHRMLSGGGQGQ